MWPAPELPHSGTRELGITLDGLLIDLFRHGDRGAAAPSVPGSKVPSRSRMTAGRPSWSAPPLPFRRRRAADPPAATDPEDGHDAPRRRNRARYRSTGLDLRIRPAGELPHDVPPGHRQRRPALRRRLRRLRHLPYSWAWLDLRTEPWVISVPAVDRYYVMPPPRLGHLLHRVHRSPHHRQRTWLLPGHRTRLARQPSRRHHQRPARGLPIGRHSGPHLPCGP